MGIRVVAVDIGSVGPSSKFAWAAFDAPERQVMAAGTDPETAVSALAPGLLSGARDGVAAGRADVGASPRRPARCVAHAGEGAERRRYQAMVGRSRRRRTGDRTGAGCVDAAPACRHGAGAGRDDTARILAARRCCAAAAGRGIHHRGRQAEPLPAGQDAADAAAAGLALAEMLDGPGPLTSTVRCAPQEPFNLLLAMALWAGLRIDPAELHAEVLVVATRPEPRAPRS